MAVHNPMARLRPLDAPYLEFSQPPHVWRVLKSKQADNARPGATWWCAVKGPPAPERWHVGNAYVETVMRDARLVYRDPSLPVNVVDFTPLPSPMELWGLVEVDSDSPRGREIAAARVLLHRDGRRGTGGPPPRTSRGRRRPSPRRESA